MSKILSYAKDIRGATAIEFAMVSPLLILTILFVMYVGMIEYLNQALDNATMRAARQIMTGYVQKNSVSQTNFRTQVLCPYLPKALSCNNVIIRIQTVSQGSKPNGYYNFVNSDATALNMPVLNVDSNPYSPGVQQAYVYMQVVYPLTSIPSFLTSLLGQNTNYNGKQSYLLESTAVFKNEQY